MTGFKVRKSVGLFALASTALVSVAGLAAADPVLVSQGSPFGSCNTGGTPTSTNYPEAEVEPWVTVNPTNPNHLIAGWQQDRWSDGGSKSLMSAYSVDGGASWNNVVVPGINACSGGSGATGSGGGFHYERASDPWTAISADGDIAYFMSLVFDNDPAPGVSGNNAMLVSRSVKDGLIPAGAVWEAPKFLINSFNANDFNDKNAITADPTLNTHAYAVWDKLANVAGKHDGAADARGRRNNAVDRGGNSENSRGAYRGPIMFTRTTDGGANWETARPIYDPGVNAQTISNQVVVSPSDGAVIDFFTNIDHNGGTAMGMIRSTDHGANFDPARLLFKTQLTRNGTITPDLKESVRDGNILFDAAVDPGNGSLYLVWQDARNQNIDRVNFSMSTNGGATWTAPAIIAKTPYSPNKLKMQSFIPSVEVGSDHRVHVSYYDFRYDNGSGEMTDYWAISCSSTCASPASWGNEVRLTPASFDMLNAPVARGHFLGDYQGLTRQGSGMLAVFGVATATDNVNEIISSHIP